MDPPRLAAAGAQRIASDPTASAFVSASAGSGKTKLLIDRLLRLMLPGPDRQATPPERILCLTFTKAGAAEMAIRLRRALARWVTAPDPALDDALRSLDLAPTGELRDKARALFAQILDTPGGLRIGTIHAFCEQLLRRFPLEAAISPHFRLVEEFDAQLALDRARETTVGLTAAAETVAVLAARLDALAHAKLTRELHTRADRLAHAHALDPDALAAALGRTLDLVHADEAALLTQAVSAHDAAGIERAVHELASLGTDTMAAKAAPLRAWLAADPPARRAGWQHWRDLLLTATGEPRSFAAVTTKFAKNNPDALATLRAEAQRVLAVEAHRRALQLIEATASLLALSGPSLAAYASDKAAAGLLDFDDLIGRTRDLLADPGVAWVLFKLDGGLDHLLLDEVQDTSAAQWAIAGSLTEEFFAGDAASATNRTVFAVGDFKQSIYSFQGADPQGFRTWRDTFRTRVTDAGRRFVEPSLTVSFRSSPAILAFVDAVFREQLASGGVAESADLPVPPHESAKPDLPGRVELWPLVAATEPAEDPERSPWQAPDRNRGLQSGEQLLATALAAHLATLIERDEIRPGEILVLVRRRTHFAGSLMRALKSRAVPVAGLDRMILTDQPAVQDLLALCETLLLPSDDLAVATVLTSPLGGLDDPSLMALALDRGPAGLWPTLQSRHHERPDWARAHAFIGRLLARTDYVSPHALLAEALGAGGGRARLLARLGPEAAEAIDELLGAALDHAANHVPSLQDFVHWLRRSGADIKREPGEAADEVRLMTVHGSKGLEARLVVLADTIALPRIDRNLLWARHAGETLPIWVPGDDLNCPPVERLRDLELARALAEANRLLYVALTRAKQRLLVCGWQPRTDLDPRTWYAHCQRAFQSLQGAEALAFEPPAPGGAWTGPHLVLTHRGNQAAHPAPNPAPTEPAAPTPDWLGAAPHWTPRPPPAEPISRRSLVPSRPEGVVFGPVPPATSPNEQSGRAEARRRGDVLHALLQHLPGLTTQARPEAARRFTRRQLDAPSADQVANQALTLIAHPALARIFGPQGRPEQRLAGLVGDVAVSGIVDRVAITPDAIDLVDFKSGRTPPADVAKTPVRYLRQMSAYRGVLQSLRPGTPVRCLLVWTEDATVAHLSDDLLDAHAPALVA